MSGAVRARRTRTRPHLRINASGKLRTDFARAPMTGLVGGGTYSGTDSMSATLNRQADAADRACGGCRCPITFADGTTDQCDSGPVRFTDVR